MVKLSIIVPTFNSSKYLDRCLKSLLQLNFSDYEVILIDDQSTDCSLKLAKMYVSAFNGKLRIFQNEQNSGLSATRNVGIKKAKGEYIYFLDSDDWIEKNIFSATIPQMEKEKLDMIFFDFYLVNTQFNIINSDVWYQNRPQGLINKQTFFYGLFLRRFGDYSWSRITKRELYVKNNIWYPSNTRLYEDLAVTYMLVENSRKIRFVKNKLYFYFRGNSNSLTRKFTYSGYLDSQKNFSGLEFLIKQNYPNLLKTMLNYKCDILFSQYLEGASEDREQIRSGILENLYSVFLKLSVKNQIKYIFLRLKILLLVKKIL